MIHYSFDENQHSLRRRLLGFAATIFASLATIATTVGPDNTYVSLPDQDITLSQSVPQQQRLFRIETSTGKFKIEAMLVTTQAVNPTLSITPIDGGNSTVSQFEAHTVKTDSQLVQVLVNVELNCNGDAGAPCTADFEASSGAIALTTNAASGTLSVKVYLEGVPTAGQGGNGYVAVEPL
jgi:hypothetical protein